MATAGFVTMVYGATAPGTADSGTERAYNNGSKIFCTIDDVGLVRVYFSDSDVATQAQMETGTSTAVLVTPGRQKNHPGHPKVWVSCGVAADIQQSFGVSSLTDTGTGVVTVNFSTNFSAATFMGQVTCEMTGTTYAVASSREGRMRSSSRAVGSVAFDCIDDTAGTELVKDPTTWHAVCFGDQ